MKDKEKHILDNLKTNDAGFTVPENYFVKFESNFKRNSNKQRTGFTHPAHYFESFEDNFFQKKTPVLPEDTGFKTPENYFNKLEDRFFSKGKSPKVISLANKKIYSIIGLSVAASILLFFSLFPFNTENNAIYLDEIEVTEIENWIDEDLVSFNSYQISEIFTETDLDLANNETDEILEYLYQSDIENLILDN